MTKNICDILWNIDNCQCLSVCLSVRLTVCMYVCMYVCIYMYVCICMYMYDVCTTSVLPFLLGGTTSISKLWKGGHRKVNDCLGGLKEFLPCWIVAWGVAMFLVKKKKTFKEKRWLWVPNLKCWSRPSLAKQSINI